MLGLRFRARAFFSCGERGPLFIAVRGPLTVAASLVAEHRLQTHRLSSCGSRAQLLRGMWDLPRPGLEPVCPALAGRFSTTAPPGKPWFLLFNKLPPRDLYEFTSTSTLFPKKFVLGWLLLVMELVLHMAVGKSLPVSIHIPDYSPFHPISSLVGFFSLTKVASLKSSPL